MRIFSRPPLLPLLELCGVLGTLVLGPVRAVAQDQVTITGRVTGAVGEPLRDANVSLFELDLGAWTGHDGAYRLVVPGARARGQQAKLSVRIIGYRAASAVVTLAPGASVEHNFQLTSDPLRLDEVVVTGAGTEQLREKLGTAMSSVDATTLQRANEANLVQALLNRHGSDGSTFIMFVLVLAAPIVILNRIIRHDTVGLETILGAICVYVLIAIAFAGIYAGVNDSEPKGFFARIVESCIHVRWSLSVCS